MPPPKITKFHKNPFTCLCLKNSIWRIFEVTNFRLFSFFLHYSKSCLVYSCNPITIVEFSKITLNMITEVQIPDMYLPQARACGSVQDCTSIYDKRAATYNDEIMDKSQEYITSSIVAQVALRVSDNFAQSAILDAGCGTGLVGQALNLLGAKIIDGLDISSAMLKIQTRLESIEVCPRQT